jgi:hypothetical protein
MILPALGLQLAHAGFSGSLHAVEPAPRIDVILWFDTEDYLLPASDDAAKRVADMLTERNIRATLKVVGEKARTLERRGRHDVITALRRHDIGFHSDFHSVHPTPSEYLAERGFLDGVATCATRSAMARRTWRFFACRRSLVMASPVHPGGAGGVRLRRFESRHQSAVTWTKARMWG